MKNILLILLVFTLLFIGCQSHQTVAKPDYPSTIVGTWEDDSPDHWKFILLEDGKIEEVIRSDAQRMVIAEGNMAIESKDFILAYQFGPCLWIYDKESNVLYIRITLDNFYIKAGEQEINYAWTDEFSGKLSEDGKRWAAEWITTTMAESQSSGKQVESGRTLYFKKISNQ